ncbi:MAG: hypothetical protein U5M23_11565 [Marinagarivorans sp.]|nr:hypothetical protein [Marinagarivorans sp.]
MKFKYRISKKTRFISHLLASACFIGLFIWGWDLPMSEVLAFFIILMVFLVAILAVSALLGFALRLYRAKKEQQSIDE